MRQRAIAPFFMLCPAMLLMSACGPAEPNNKELSPAEAAKGAERISARHFGRLTVPCREPSEMAQALLKLTSRDLAEGARTRLLDHSSDDVRLKDGSGKIVAIVYSVSEEDEESVITTAEHFLVNQTCQVLHWGSAVSAGS